MSRNAEANIQAGVLEFLRVVAPDVFVFHVPNGGLRSKSEAARLKWQGVVPGVPDLVLVLPDIVKGARVAFFEIKTDKGKLSDDQARVMHWLDDAGAPVWVIRSVEDARAALARLGIKTREAKPPTFDPRRPFDAEWMSRA